MRSQLELRIAFHAAGIDQSRERRGGLVRPTEWPPQPVIRRRLGWIVAPRSVAGGVQPNRPVKAFKAGEDRFECGVVKRNALHVGEDLSAERAEIPNGPVDLSE